MDVENAVYPTASRVEALMADDSGGPVVMLNLLKFRAKAVYPDGRPSDLTGRQAYDLYGARDAERHRQAAAGECCSAAISRRW